MGTSCPSCGFDNPPGMRFCGGCGARLEPAAAPEEQLLDRVRQAGLEASGQRRHVTVLFADLSGYTALSQSLEVEETYNLIQEYSRLLAAAVYEYDGVVDKFTGDGLMALFGAPIAHENNAEHACRAALAMQAAVAQLSRRIQGRLGHELQLHLGLHAGAVIVGGVGSNLKMSYTAIGDTVNLAARLEQAAGPGTIVVSEAVFRQTRVLFDYEPLAPLALKGIQQAVPAFRLLRPKARPGTARGIEGLRAPLIGRQAELGRLQQAVDRVLESGHGLFALLAGEAGLGKTRITAELTGRLVGSEVKIVEGHSLTYRRAVPYWIIAEVLRDLIGLGGEADARTARERLTAYLSGLLEPAAAAQALPYLETVLERVGEPAPAGAGAFLDASQLRQRVFVAVRDLLAAEARRQPVLIILEDVHWADEASLELAGFLLDTLRQLPLVLYATTRPVYEPPVARLVERARSLPESQYLEIQLQTLSEAESGALLARLLAAAEWPADFQAQVVQRAAGNPFYLEEMLRMLIDQGVLRRQGTSWAIAPDAGGVALGVPETLQELILARFDRLEPEQRALLQMAAVIGRRFSLELLAAVLRMRDRRALEAAVDQLTARDFVGPVPDAPEPEYLFRHVLVSDTIYGTLLKRERGELHGQVGAAIEAVYADQLESQIELLARHYSWSPRHDRALHYLILAGQRSSRTFANEQARQHFEQALELLPLVEHTPEQWWEVHVGLGDVLVLTGEYERARGLYLAARQQLPASTAPARRSRLERSIAATYERQGGYDQALQCLTQAQALMDSEPEAAAEERARVLNDSGWIHFQRGNAAAARDCLEQALALVAKSVDYDVVASIHNRLGAVAFQSGDLDSAANHVRRGLALRESLGDLAGMARMYINLGMMSWRRGDWDHALEHYARSLGLLEQIGDADGITLGHLNRGILHTDQGNRAEAEAELRASLQRAQHTGNVLFAAQANMQLGRLCLMAGEWERALEPLAASQSVLLAQEAFSPLADVLVLTGEAQRGQGNLDPAAASASEALRLISGHDLTGAEEHGRALRLVGLLALDRGRLADAEHALRESAEIFNRTGEKLEQGRALYCLALLARHTGDPLQVRLHLSEARLIFEDLGAQHDAERCRQLLADLAAHVVNRDSPKMGRG